MRGTVIRHIGKSNFGFIACDDRVERFFHAGMCHPESPFHNLEVSDRVELDPIVVRVKGQLFERAANVRLVKKGGSTTRESSVHVSVQFPDAAFADGHGLTERS